MSSLRACVEPLCSSNDCWFEAASRLVPDDEGFQGALFGRFMLLEAVGGTLVALLEEGCALALLLAAGVHLALGKAAGYEGTSPGLALSGRCGPVSIRPEADMGLSFVGEMASGSGSLDSDMPFPFFFDVSGVTSSRLAELLVLQVLFQWVSSPAEGVTELISREKGMVCWQVPCLNRDSWPSGYTQGWMFPGVPKARVCPLREFISMGGGSSSTE